jgi:hypothetical protein
MKIIIKLPSKKAIKFLKHLKSEHPKYSRGAKLKNA